MHEMVTRPSPADGDEHHRLRRLVAKAFTPRATARLAATITDVITELVDRQCAECRCDVVTDIARKYPIPIICALLGAPSRDWRLFSCWTEHIMKAFSWGAAAEEAVIVAAWDELDAYIDELRMLAAGLLMAGTDTTRNQLAGSVHALCDHPDQWALLSEHPGLAANAVEETLRHSPIAFGTVRVAVEDVELAGLLIPCGTVVIANTAAANRHPAVYDDPDRLDITRAGAPPILTFGGGTHYCLGSHLARLELTEALGVMTRRMRNPRLTGPAPWKPLSALSGPATHPIAFDVSH